MNETLYRAFAEVAEANPRSWAICSLERCLTYEQLGYEVRRLAEGLHAGIGVGPGTHVALLLPDGPEWLIASLAVQALGAVEVPARLPHADESFADEAWAETAEWVRLTDCRVALAAGPGIAEWLQDVLPELVVAEPSALPGGPGENSPQLVDLQRDSADLAVILPTSGTTGPPKPVMLSHRGLLHFHREFPLRAGLRRDDVCLGALPLWHLFGRLAVYTPLLSGMTTWWLGLQGLGRGGSLNGATVFPSFPVVWEVIYRSLIDGLRQRPLVQHVFRPAIVLTRHHQRARERLAAPPTWRDVTSTAGLGRLVALTVSAATALPHWLAAGTLYPAIRQRLGPALRLAVVGDATLPGYLDEAVRGLGLELLEAYGSTEQGVSMVRGPGRSPAGGVGEPLPGVDWRVIPERGGARADGVVGEIAVRGPQLFLGYYGAAERSQAAWVQLDGEHYLRTGDRGLVDRSGRLILLGRCANRIHLPGYPLPVSPEPAEGALRESVFIDGAMLFVTGEEVLAALVLPNLRETLRWYAKGGRERERAVGSLPLDPFEMMAYAQAHQGLVREVLGRPETVALFRQRIRHLVSGEMACPTRFGLAWQPLRPGRELTRTLKLRRDYVREHLVPAVSLHAL